MTSLKKSNGNTAVIPSVRNFFDNFWNADPFFSEDFFKNRNQWLPAVNIKDNKNNFEINMAAPGFDKKDFDVKIENDTLCISATKEENTEEKVDNYTRKEFSFNAFERSFSLPTNVDTKDVDAKYADGILTLTLQKNGIEEPEIKQIAIK